MKIKVIKESEDDASCLKLGDIVEVDLDKIYLEQITHNIVNIGGAHYLVKELNEYFEICDKIIIFSKGD